MLMTDKVYLGDSVYAEMVGGMIKLTTDNGVGIDQEIYLEPEVYNALVLYVERLNAPMPMAQEDDDE